MIAARHRLRSACLRSLQFLCARGAPVALSAAIPLFLGCGNGAQPPRENLGESSAALTANDKTAYDYFISKGLTGAQAAAIVGNFDIESGMDPTSVEPGGPGRGIAQWSAGGRWDTTSGDNLIAFASQHGEDHLALGTQLDFVWFELTTFSDYGLAKLRAATTVTDAVNAFEAGFEGCGTCDSSARVSDAQMVLAAYGADVAGDGGGNDDEDAGVSCTVTTGESGECISTSACEALGNHLSTPGLCPGAADIQCCTAVQSEGGTSESEGGAGAGGSGSGSGSSTSDGGASDTSASSGGCTISKNGGAGGRGQDDASIALVIACGALVMWRSRLARRGRYVHWRASHTGEADEGREVVG